MYQQTVLKGTQIGREVAYRDPNALFSLVGTDGNGKNAYLPIGEDLLSRHMLLLGSACAAAGEQSGSAAQVCGPGARSRPFSGPMPLATLAK